jgi:hypothetical protein
MLNSPRVVAAFCRSHPTRNPLHPLTRLVLWRRPALERSRVGQ